MLTASVVVLLVTALFNCEAIQVKVNNEIIMDVPARVDPDDIRNIKVTSLEFIKHKDWKEPLLKIENFDDLQRISIDNNGLIVIPALEDLPELRELSLNQNGITKVYTSHFYFTELTKISLANNFINAIYNSAFNKELRELDVKCNALTEVSASWFANPGNLEVLDLSNNKITAIKQRLFGRFTKLTQLYLAGNKISTIDMSSFTFEAMHKLDLSMNLITDLNPSIFIKRSVDVKALNITYNKLNFLRESFVNKIYDHSETKEISTFGNPWQCFCLRRMENLFMKNNIVQIEPEESYNNAKCIFSLIYPKTCEEVVDPELYETYSKFVARKKTACSKPKSVASLILAV